MINLLFIKQTHRAFDSYLLKKKRFSFFFFTLSLPIGRARLETVFDVGLRQNGDNCIFFCNMKSKFSFLRVKRLNKKQTFLIRTNKNRVSTRV